MIERGGRQPTQDFDNDLGRRSRLQRLLFRRCCARDGEAEDRPATRVVFGPHLAAMRHDDRPADRQADAHPGSLGGDEGLEQPLADIGRQARAGVAATVTSTRLPSADRRVAITSSRTGEPAIASAALRTRFSSTCWIWTRSMKTSVAAGSNRSVRATRRPSLPMSARAATSSIVLCRFSICRSALRLRARSRTWRIVAPARSVCWLALSSIALAFTASPSSISFCAAAM
jgi:hypothetical protein